LCLDEIGTISVTVACITLLTGDWWVNNEKYLQFVIIADTFMNADWRNVFRQVKSFSYKT